MFDLDQTIHNTTVQSNNFALLSHHLLIDNTILPQTKLIPQETNLNAYLGFQIYKNLFIFSLDTDVKLVSWG